VFMLNAYRLNGIRNLLIPKANGMREAHRIAWEYADFMPK